MQDNLSLHGSAEDLHLMGIVPDVPFADLNLAGSQGWPSPATLAHALPTEQVTTNAPTFTAPDMQAPSLAPYDLVEPGITYRPAFTPDPLLPNPQQYDHPLGLDFYRDSPDMADPSMADLLSNDLPAGLVEPQEPDPTLQDLQAPDLRQQTHMLDRPGDLDPSALQVMHQSATYQQLDHKEYPALMMDASGVNTRRSRHLGLLMRGLDSEER